MADFFNGGQLQVNPSLVTADENALALLGRLGGRDAGIVAVETDTGASKDNAGIEGGERATLGGFRCVLTEALLMLSWLETWWVTGLAYLSGRLSELEGLTGEHCDMEGGSIGYLVGEHTEKRFFLKTEEVGLSFEVSDYRIGMTQSPKIRALLIVRNVPLGSRNPA